MVFEVTFKRKAIWKVWEHYVKCLRKELGKVTTCGGIDTLRMFVHTYMTVYISVISSAFSSLCYRHGEWVQIKQNIFKKSTVLFCCLRHRLAGTRTPKCFCPF